MVGPRKPLRGRHRKPEKIYPFPEADDRIHDVFRHHGFADYPHEKRHQLVRFYEHLMNNQMKENFTRLVKIRDIALKHFIDCLMVPRLMELPFPLMDMGTGAGFPGIPLKVEFPNDRIILAEGVGKRVEYLKRVREDLKLRELDIIGRYVTPDFHYPVAGIITRAVLDISETLRNVENCLSPGGKMIFMKGPGVDQEVKKARQEVTNFELSLDRAYELPNSPHQRRLVVYTKIANGVK